MHKKLIIFGFAFLLLNIPNISFAQENDKLVILHTKSGDIVIEFFPEDSPNHVENFVKLVDEGFYDRSVFHRVIKDFMIQGGDPKTRPGNFQSFYEWGTGNPGYSIDAEFNDIKHNRGIVSMARSADPNSAGSQFFIVHKDSNFLDGQYTVFGRIVTQESFATLDKIALLDTPHSIGQASSGEQGSTIPIKWGEAEILSAEVVNRSEISNILNLDEPERMSSTPEKPPSSGEYSNEELGFSFLAPTGWQIQEPTKTHPSVPDVVAIGPKIGEINPYIAVSLNSTSIDFQQFLSEKKDTLQSLVNSGLIEIISEEPTNVNNKNAFVWESRTAVNQDGTVINAKFKEITIAVPGKFYTITYFAEEAHFENNIDDFNEAVNSFVILSDNGQANQTPSEGGGCLIATAAYGSELAPQVQQLRELRDNTILKTRSGLDFMSGFNQFYYSFSPAIADLARENPFFKETIKLAITPLLSSLSILNFVDIDSEEEMLGYGISIILLNIGMYFAGPAFAIRKLTRR